MDDYFKKRQKQCIAEAFDYANSIESAFGRPPVPADFWEEFPLFIDGDSVDKYADIPIKKQLGEAYDTWIHEHKAPFDSFEEFLRAAKQKSINDQ